MNRSTATQTGSGTSTTDDMTQQMRETGTQVKDQMREQASSRISGQKDRAASGLHTMADAVRKTGDQLKSENPSIANFADSAAGRIEQFAGRLENEDMGQLLDDVEHFARQRPALFLGGAFVLGMVAARFFKSSSPDDFDGSARYERYSGRPAYTSYPSRGRSPYQRADYGTGAAMSRGYGSAAGSPAVRGTPVSRTDESASATEQGGVTDGTD